MVCFTLNEFQEEAWKEEELVEERDAHIEEIQQELERLNRIAEAKIAAASASMKRDAAAGLSLPSAETQRLTTGVDEVSEQFSAALSRFQNAIGLSDELLALLEMQQNRQGGWRTWRHELIDVDPTEEALEGLGEALEALLHLVDPCWLISEQARYARLGLHYYTEPLHIISGLRISGQGRTRPQRYAEMLLLTRDFLEGRPDLDFWALSMAVAEVKRLGSQLSEIAALGHVAGEKLRRLSERDDDAVAATVYELLVGATAVHHGLDMEMLAEQRNIRTPDFRVHGLPVPAVIECKRRVGLTNYVRHEAENISRLYEAVRPILRGSNHGWSLEVEFVEEIASVTFDVFTRAVQETIEQSRRRTPELQTSWGKIHIVSLPPSVDIPETKLYSPEMLRSVFGWSEEMLDWDGLVCEVTNPSGLIISRAFQPTCLKWRSVSPSVTAKRARGITSLYGSAVQQIPPGEMGIIYIAYPEFARAEVADARTRDILESDWYHSPHIRVPLVFVTRLYPRPVSDGLPDLIENVLKLLASWAPEDIVEEFPSRVFTV